MWNKISPSRKFVAFLFFIIASVSCSSSAEKKGNFGYKLCEIHRSVLAKNIRPEETAIQVAERIEKELPEFYENQYVHIHLAAPDNQYEMMQDTVRLVSGEDWECEAVKEFLGL